MNTEDGLQQIVKKMEEERLENWQKSTRKYVSEVENSIRDAIILDKSYIRYEIDGAIGMFLRNGSVEEDAYVFRTGREILKALSALNIEASIVNGCIVLPLPNFKVLPAEFCLST